MLDALCYFLFYFVLFLNALLGLGRWKATVRKHERRRASLPARIRLGLKCKQMRASASSDVQTRVLASL